MNRAVQSLCGPRGKEQEGRAEGFFTTRCRRPPSRPPRERPATIGPAEGQRATTRSVSAVSDYALPTGRASRAKHDRWESFRRASHDGLAVLVGLSCGAPEIHGSRQREGHAPSTPGLTADGIAFVGGKLAHGPSRCREPLGRSGASNQGPSPVPQAPRLPS